MVHGLPNSSAFIAGLVAGIVLYFLRIPVMTIGIGLYLPMMISAAAFIGGVLRFVVQKFAPGFEERGTLISSGFLGGEGVTGVLIAIIKVLTMS
jgi:uncharacterized oligopeptide transporter (OPT) family protein